MYPMCTRTQFIIGIIFGSLIACSPTKFNQNQQIAAVCDSSATSCITKNGSTEVSQSYKVGSGKVDILFINDNSASMSKVQVSMSAKFVGFIQNLDSKSADYRIAMITTDLNSVIQNRFLNFSNGKKFITNADSDRVSLFNNAIVRDETLVCENFIIGMFNTFGTGFQSTSQYANEYYSKCPSPDTRGIYAANVVISENSSSFLRDDANLNIILISNDNVRQGKALEANDSAGAFISMMQNKHPNKYWDFNSIIVKDEACRQSQTLYTATSQIVMNQYGPAVSAGIGTEYVNLSNSAAKDIDGNPRPRGQILDICQSDYSHHFSAMSIQIAQEARMFTMKCVPSEAPSVIVAGNPQASVSYTVSGNKIIFAKGTEGTSVTINYKCYTGPT
ncbi:MAG: hypothetical protein AABY53_03210 [Bdellovibrionota bacterium]